MNAGLALPCRLPNVRHDELVNRLRCTRVQVIDTLALRKALRALVEDRPDALREVLLEREAGLLLPRPRLAFSDAEVLLADKRRGLEVRLGLRLGVVDGLSRPEGALERGGVYGREVRGGEGLGGCFGLLW